MVDTSRGVRRATGGQRVHRNPGRHKMNAAARISLTAHVSSRATATTLGSPTMTTNLTTATTLTTELLAADLRERAPIHDGRRCDALAPCRSCQTGRRVVQVARRLSEVPAQRKASK
jgi:hypothetical protein